MSLTDYIKQGNLEMVIGLVEEYKLKPEERNDISLTPLQIACLCGEKVII